MKLRELLKGLSCRVQGDLDTEVTGLSYDSRKIQPGNGFFCIKGFETDGHRYAAQAVEKGASFLMVSDPQDLNIPQVIVENDRLSMAQISANFYGNPAQSLRMVGVTGTNGKTSTTYFLKSIFEHEGSKVGMLGTISNKIGEEVLPAVRTTPESPDLQRLLREMLDKGVDTVVMEVSSSALVLDRVASIRFDAGVFTNLTQDHLDFHGDFEHYRDAKAILFGMSENSLINIDDPYGRFMLDSATGRTLTYSAKSGADIMATDIRLYPEGCRFVLQLEGAKLPIVMNIPGMFTVYNALSAISAARALGVDLMHIKQGLEQVKNVPGRFQQLDTRGGKYSVILDYAHTPDSLENALLTVREFAKGRVVCIIGCGGNRDNGKRPIMGEIAERLSDLAVITSDNPRFEEPGDIISMILKGMKKDNHVVIENRREAIKYAIENAQEDDCILLAGKGHEDYQEIKGVKTPFDEKQVVSEILDELGY